MIAKELARRWRTEYFGDGSKFSGSKNSIRIDDIEFEVEVQIYTAVLAERERCAKIAGEEQVPPVFVRGDKPGEFHTLHKGSHSLPILAHQRNQIAAEIREGPRPLEG